MVDPLAGVLVSTRYRLVGQLGSGATGIVWDARDEQLDLAVAIKELRPPDPASERWLAEMLELLKAEARYTGQLAHPNIVAVYDVVSDFGRPWVIMPRVTGRSLATEIAADGVWDPARAARLGLHLVQALEAAHADGVAHGAVKPSNVLIPEFGVPMLTDFSLAPSSHEADLLGLGATLYFAVEGHHPRSAGPEPARNAGQIAEVIQGLLAADPGQRPTLVQVREQLTDVVAQYAAQRRKAQLSAETLDAGPDADPGLTDSSTPPPATGSVLEPTGTAADVDVAASLDPTPSDTTVPSVPNQATTRSEAGKPAVPPGFVAAQADAAPSLAAPSLAAPSLLAPSVGAQPVASPSLASPSLASPSLASPSLASPSLASPSLASPSLASPSLASPSLASPSLASPPMARPAAEPLTAGHAAAAGSAVVVAPTTPDPVALTTPSPISPPAAAPTPPPAAAEQGSISASSTPDPAKPASEPAAAPSARGRTAPASNRRRIIAAAVVVAVFAVAVATFAFLRWPGIGQARPQLILSGPEEPDTTAPQQPVNVTVSGRSTDMVTLMWDAAVDDVGVTKYRVQRDGIQVGTTPTPDYTDKGLAVDTTYTYTVIAVDSAGNVSVASAAVSATTLKVPDTTKPSTPANLRITGRSTTSIVLGWTAATDDVGVARYEVRRDGRTIATPAAARFTDTGLAPGTSHSYVVVAIDATGNTSAPTAPVTGVTLTAPDTAAPIAPGSPRTTGATTTTISLAWTASSDNTGVTNYLVYRNGVLVASPTALTHTDTGLTPATTYTYHIKAVDGAGNVSAAAVISAATVAPQVSGINTAISVGGVPACTVTITATIAVTAGPVTVGLQVTINGATNTRSLSFPGSGPASQVIDIGTAPGTQDGSVQVSSTSPNPVTSTKTWTASDACRPGFSVSSPTAQPDSCGSPTISGTVRVTTRNNPGPEQYTVQMLIDGNNVDETTTTLTPNSFEVLDLASPDPYPNGTYAVSYRVTPQGGSSVTSSIVNTEVNC